MRPTCHYGKTKWIYIYSQKVKKYLSKLGLRELVIEQHGPEGPAITKLNKKNYAIYGIWGSPGLNIIEGGYLDFNQGPKYDHRKICIKLSTTTAFGNRYLISKYSSSQKLRLLHPTGQHTYMSKIRQLTWYHRILPWLRELEIHHN